MGEVTLGDKFGKCIAWSVRKYRLAVNLEIGSWDGTGSTSCFIEGMNRLKFAGVKDLRLQCVEVDAQKFAELKENLRECEYAVPYHMSSIGLASFLPRSFEEVWNSPYNMHRVRGVYERDLVRSWYEADLANMPLSGFLESEHCLPAYDCVLIDGSEFTGYSEFVLLRERARFFFLDDVHGAYKCNQAYEELKADPLWIKVADDPGVRNGFAAFVKKAQ
jgi:hypothetical protein